MKKHTILLSLLLISVFVISTFADDSDGRRAKAPALRIGLSEGYSPYPGFTLAANFSKMKQHLESEFGATVTSVHSWNSSTLGNLDILIIPGRIPVYPPISDIVDLRNWISDGGCCIILWYPMNLISTSEWWAGGQALHDNVIDDFGMEIKAADAGDLDFYTFSGTIGTDPYQIHRVRGGVKTAWMHSISGNAKFLAWNGNGKPVCSYNPKAGDGMLFVIGNVYAFQNTRIDTYDNKEFLFNLISACTGGGGGGGGGGGTGVIVKKVKGRPGVVAPGNDIKLIARVKNTSSSASAITSIEFYFSTDQVLNAADTFIDSAGIPSLNPGKGKRIKIIGEVPVLADGFYYIIGKVLSSNDVKESKKQVEVR